MQPPSSELHCGPQKTFDLLAVERQCPRCENSVKVQLATWFGNFDLDTANPPKKNKWGVWQKLGCVIKNDEIYFEVSFLRMLENAEYLDLSFQCVVHA